MLSFIQVTHVCFGHGVGTTLVTEIMDFSSCIKVIDKILVKIQDLEQYDAQDFVEQPKNKVYLNEQHNGC